MAHCPHLWIIRTSDIITFLLSALSPRNPAGQNKAHEHDLVNPGASPSLGMFPFYSAEHHHTQGYGPGHQRTPGSSSKSLSGIPLCHHHNQLPGSSSPLPLRPLSRWSSTD